MYKIQISRYSENGVKCMSEEINRKYNKQDEQYSHNKEIEKSELSEKKYESLPVEELCRIIHELEMSRDRYLDFYDLAPVGYITLNIDGFIEEANPAAAAMLGVSRDFMSGKAFAGFIEPDDQEIFSRYQKELFEVKDNQLYFLRVKGNDDSESWIQVESIYFLDNDRPVCRIIITDINERRRMEGEISRYKEQALQNQRLESLGILAGGIAHNFNNLLTGIFGYIELADKKANDPGISRYLSEALKMSDRAKGLTGQLLTFSRGGDTVRQNGYLYPLIKDSVKFALSGSDIASRFDIEENLYPCNFDTNQINQVIEDIILNARQAMPHGGAVDVAAGNIYLKKNEVNSLPEGKYVRISIKDYGFGMSPEVLSRIFDPFFTTRTSSHGLGLSASYSIISRHDGAMTVESEPEKGSTVNIYLPAVTEKVYHRESEADSEHSGYGTIILMDDEECIRDSLSSMLMSMGYDVLHMEQGDDVISFFRHRNEIEKISAIILDLVIPGGMGGKSTVTEIRKINPDIPVFAISGNTDDPVMVKPQNYGFTASISKPFLMKELAEMLNRNINIKLNSM